MMKSFLRVLDLTSYGRELALKFCKLLLGLPQASGDKEAAQGDLEPRAVPSWLFLTNCFQLPCLLMPERA
jgi:hypothetical protein